MLITLSRDIAAPPAAVWPLVSDPERMNRWSTARIEPVAPGDAGRYDAVGALRSVRIALPGRPVLLEEVIEEASAPGRLVYRVIEGGAIRSHRGVVTLEEAGGGTRLRWEVRAGFAAPGLGALAKGLLERELGRSLDALARVAPSEPPSDGGPPERSLDETALLPGLYEDAERIIREQRALADDLEARDDGKRWFPRVYEYVSEAQVAACRAGRFAHPAWVLRLLPAFHAYFSRSLARARGLEAGPVESHWRSAFRAMDEGAA